MRPSCKESRHRAHGMVLTWSGDTLGMANAGCCRRRAYYELSSRVTVYGREASAFFLTDLVSLNGAPRNEGRDTTPVFRDNRTVMAVLDINPKELPAWSMD
jgi:hypothetical protein